MPINAWGACAAGMLAHTTMLSSIHLEETGGEAIEKERITFR